MSIRSTFQSIIFFALPMALLSQNQIGVTIIGESASDQVGISTRLSGDGKTLVFGENFAGVNDNGQVRVYKNFENNWVQVGGVISTSSGSTGSVTDVNANGTVVAVSVTLEDVVKVYQFTTSWNQIGGDIPIDESGTDFGQFISLNDAGNVIAIGSSREDSNGVDAGSVEVYELVSNDWVQLGNTILGSASNERFGLSVDINGEGTTVAVGAPYYEENDDDGNGRVQVYTIIGDSWIKVGDDIIGTQLQEFAGRDVSLNEAGDVLAIGSKFYTASSGLSTGGVRVFQNIGGVWIQKGSVLEGNTDGGNFGYSIDLNSEGNRMSVAAPWDNNSVNYGYGKVDVFEFDETDWVLEQSISGETIEYNGVSIGLSADGYTLAIGSPGYNSSRGRVRAFDLLDEPPVFVSGNAVSYQENGLDIVINVDANDGDGSGVDIGLTYSLSGSDNDNDLFKINALNGELSFINSPDFETPLDLNADNTYTVDVAVSDGEYQTSQNITITVADLEVEGSSDADISGFSFPEQTGPAIINATLNTVDIEVSYDTDISALTPNISVSEGADVSPASGSLQNFESAVLYVVTAENGVTSKNWVVNVTNQPSPENDILDFTLAEQVTNATIDNELHKVTLTVLYGTDVTQLIPEISLSSGASITPNSNEVQDFSNLFTYTVTAENGTTQDWAISIGSQPIHLTPDLDWVSTYPLLGVGVQEIAMDELGYTYYTGSFESTRDFDDGPDAFQLVSNGGTDIFIMKKDPDGNFLWAKSIGGIGQDVGESIRVDQNGDLLITGYFMITADFDPGSEEYILNGTSTGNTDIFILKLTSDGDLIWAKSIEGSTGNDRGESLDLDDENNIYITGYYRREADFDPGSGVNLLTPIGNNDVFVLKLNSNGDFQWAHTIGGAGESSYGRAIEINKNSKVIISGSYGGTVDFDHDPVNSVTQSGNGPFILSLDKQGNYQWVRTMSSTGSGYTLDSDCNGNIYVGGVFSGTPTLWPGGEAMEISGADDAFILKLDMSGNLIWDRKFGSTGYELTYAVDVNDAGEVFVGGGFQSTSDFNPTSGEVFLTASGGFDAFLVKMDVDANFFWAQSLGSSGSEYIIHLLSDKSGNIISTGSFGGIVDFDPLDGDEIIDPVGTDGFIWSLSEEAKSSRCACIESFSFDEETNIASIDFENRLITPEVASSEDISSLIPTIILSTGATISPTIGSPQDFSDTVTYTVTAEDGITTQEWHVLLAFDPNTDTDILTFELPEQSASAVIDADNHTVDIAVVYLTDISSLTPTITVADGATISPLSEAIQDFTTPVTYTVTAKDGSTTQEWVVTVTIAPNTETDILTFELPEQSASAVIDSDNHTADIAVGYGTNVSLLTPTITMADGATISPLSEAIQDFTNPVTYTVTAEDGSTTQDWMVTVAIAPNSEADILTFVLSEQSESAVIDADNHTVDMEVVYGTNIGSLSPSIILSANATVTPSSEAVQDFTNPVTYTVTAEDGTTTQDWIVTVSIAPNTETDILTFELPEQSASAVIEADNHTVDVAVVYGTDVSLLSPTITLSDGASISPLSEVFRDFTNPVTYTVTAEDGVTIQDWVVSVSESSTPDILQIGNDIDGEVEFDNSGGSISLSKDGTTVAIGAIENSVLGPSSGHVRVFRYQDEIWTQIGQDIDAEDSGDRFGFAVSLNEDGTMVAIGAPYNALSGHVRVLKLVDNLWEQVGSDIDGVKTSEFFGHSVSLNNDGTILAVGAPYNSSQAVHAGLVRMFQFDGSDWVQIGDDLLSYTQQDYFGFSVSINSSGSIVAVGSEQGEDNLTNSGYVKVFENQGSEWVQIGSTIYGENVGEYSGSSISINAVGNIVAVGAPLNDIAGNDSGLARVYKLENSEWSKVGSDLMGESEGDKYGTSVSLDNSGKVLAIGGIFNDGNVSNSGHTRVFQNVNDNWNQLGSDIDGEGGNDKSGSSISLSGTGTILGIGAPGNRGVNGLLSGHVRIYSIPIDIVTSNETDILTFTFPEQTNSEIIDTDNHTISLEVNYDSDPTSLIPTITLSNGASVAPRNGNSQDFTNPVTYTVTAEDGTTTQDWVVTVSIDAQIWTGATDNNWFDPSNWDNGTLPQLDDNVIIHSTANDPVIDGDAGIDNLTIGEGVLLTLHSGSSLAIFGNIDGSGEAIIHRNVTGSSGYSVVGNTVTVVTGEEYLTVPNHMYTYVNDAWSSSLPVAAQGFFVAYKDANPVFSMRGTPSTGNHSYAVAYTDDATANDYELTANPYNAAISHSSFIAANGSGGSGVIDGFIYLWEDGGFNNGDGTRAGSYVTVSSDGTPVGGSFDGYIRSGQGFFVNAAATGNVTYTTDMQTVGNNSDAGFFRSAIRTVKLSLSNGTYADELMISLKEDATEGIDLGLDGNKFINSGLSFYSIVGDNKLVIQSISNELKDVVKIPLGYETAEMGVFTLQINELKNIPAEIGVILEDTDTGMEYDLRTDGAIDVSLTSVSSQDRFNLILKPSEVLGIQDMNMTLFAYGTSSSVKVYYSAALTEEIVKIYDMSGRLVYEEEVFFDQGKAVLQAILRERMIYILQVGDKRSKFSLN